MTVRYTARALADVDQILSNIAKDNPLAASRVFARIEQIVVRHAARERPQF